jgi:hypothetical protein
MSSQYHCASGGGQRVRDSELHDAIVNGFASKRAGMGIFEARYMPG